MLHVVCLITLVWCASAGGEIGVDQEEDVTFRPIPCQKARQCMTELGVHSDCVKRLCVCVNESKYLKGDTPTCFKTQLDVGGKCESTAECNMTSAECKQQSCECMEGFVAAKDKSSCLAGAKLWGEPCEIDEQCESKSLGDVACTDPKSMGNKVCSCAEGHRKSHYNRCYKKKSIGESCETDTNCEHIEQTYCDKICGCSKGFVPNAQNSECLPVAAEYSSQCEEDIQCSEGLGDDLICHDKHCECKNDLKFDEAIKKCTKMEVVKAYAVEEEKEGGRGLNQEIKQGEVTEVTTVTNPPPEHDPNVAKSDLSDSSAVEIRISSTLLTSAVLAALFVSWLYRPT